MDADVHAVCADRRRAADVSDLLLAAFTYASLEVWRAAVRMLQEAIEDIPSSASNGAHGRLAQFLNENSDLLIDA